MAGIALSLAHFPRQSSNAAALAMNALAQILLFGARHFLFVAATLAAACVAWTAVYLALLLLAMFTNGEIGGPLAYPAGIVAIIGCGAVLGWGIFMPACGAGLLVCSIRGWPKLAGIPIAFVTAGFLGYGAYWIFAKSMGGGAPSAGGFLVGFMAFMSLPLGLQWWFTEGPGALWELFRRWRAGRRSDGLPDPPRSLGSGHV